MLEAYLLAAGNGRRAGGPKAWLVHEGRPLLQHQLEFLLTRFAPEAIAATIQESWLQRCRELQPKVRWVAQDPETSPLAALQNLLRGSSNTGWFFLHHVDMPVWEPGLFDVLERALPEAESQGAVAMAPAFEGHKGHPVLLSGRLRKELLGLDPMKDRLDYFLRERPEKIVPVPFACVLENWNTPA